MLCSKTLFRGIPRRLQFAGPRCRVRLFDNSAGSALRDSDCWNWRSMAQGFLLVAAVRRNGRAGGRVSRGAYVRWMCRYRSVWIAAPRSMFAGNRRCARLRQYTPSGQGLWRLPVRESDFGSGYHYTTWLGARCRVFDENKNPFLSEDGRSAEWSILSPKGKASITDVWTCVDIPSCSRCTCATRLGLFRIPGRIRAVAPFAGGLKGSEVHNRVRNPVYIVT